MLLYGVMMFFWIGCGWFVVGLFGVVIGCDGVVKFIGGVGG